MTAPRDRLAVTRKRSTGRRHHHRGATSLGLLLATLLAPVAPACGNSNSGALLAAEDACHQNSDCQAGLLCALGACRAMCETAADCGAGGQCVDDGDVAVCQYAAEANTPCNVQSDCPAPLACASDYRCRNLCSTSNDCNQLGISGRVCATDAQGVHYCANPSDVNATTGALDDAPPAGAPDTGVVEPVVDSSTAATGPESGPESGAPESGGSPDEGGPPSFDDASTIEDATVGSGDSACDGSGCALACEPTQTLCAPDGGSGEAGPYCANTGTDSANCGTCGTVCPAGTLCASGSCASACGSLPCPTYLVPVNATITWTAPATGSYRIEAWGASGGGGGTDPGTAGGLGADVGGVFSLSAGEQLRILVGTAGPAGPVGHGGGGGGGTFVVGPGTMLLLAAGGGGGGGATDAGYSASLTGTAVSGVSGGAGGTSGAGGAGGGTGGGGGGGGFSSDGMACGAGGGGGASFGNGGGGGSCEGYPNAGFGGGGGGGDVGGGGGGGYSGGG